MRSPFSAGKKGAKFASVCGTVASSDAALNAMFSSPPPGISSISFFVRQQTNTSLARNRAFSSSERDAARHPIYFLTDAPHRYPNAPEAIKRPFRTDRPPSWRWGGGAWRSSPCCRPRGASSCTTASSGTTTWRRRSRPGATAPASGRASAPASCPATGPASGRATCPASGRDTRPDRCPDPVSGERRFWWRRRKTIR